MAGTCNGDHHVRPLRGALVVGVCRGCSSRAQGLQTGCARESAAVDHIIGPGHGPVIQKWQQERFGYYQPTLAAAYGGCPPRMWAGAAPWCNHLGYAGDLIVVATSPKNVHNMYTDLHAACRSNGRRLQPEKLRLWSTFPGNPVRVEGLRQRIEASIETVPARSGTGWELHRPSFEPPSVNLPPGRAAPTPTCSAYAPRSFP